MADLKYELAKQGDGLENDLKPEVLIDDEPKKTLTPRQRTWVMIIVAVIAFIALMFLIGTIVLGVQVSKLKSTIKDMKDSAPCTTVDCINTVSDLMSSVDPTVDPCEDFHQYACGKWPEKNPLPIKDKTWAPLHKLRVSNEQTIQRLIKRTYTRIRYSKNEALRKVFTFYDSCMDEKTIEKVGKQPLMDLIEEIGSCPRFSTSNSSWNASSWDYLDVVSKVQREFPTSVFFQIWVHVLQSNTSVPTIMMSREGLGLRASRYNSTSKDNVKYVAAYKNYIIDLLKVLGISSNNSVEMMESIFSVEFDIAVMDGNTRSRSNKLMKLKELDKYNLNGTMSWTKFYKKVFRDTDFKPDENTILKVYDINYFSKLGKYLDEKPKVDLANYIVFRMVDRYSKLLSKKYQKPYEDFLKVFEFGSGSENPRWEVCISEVKNNFGMAIGRMFVDEVFRNGSKEEAEELVEDMKSVFIDDFDNVDWMDDETRIAAKEKAKAMHGNIGYPEFIMDDQKLAALYKLVKVTNDTYFANVVSMEKSYVFNTLQAMGKVPSRKSWVITPTTINAAYAPTTNTMDIPAGILRKPLFSNTYPGSFNFGAIGAIIGHEMTHGFDTTGKKFNQYGHGQKWWSNASNENFDREAQCFVDQYSNFTYMGMSMNGRRILGEVIADNGGTEIAFKAYKLWVKDHGKERQLPGIKLTHEQVFFVAYAQIFCSVYAKESVKMYMNRFHPINPLRVRGVAMNSKEFAKAFKCPIGSPMNPAKKCKIW